MTTRPFPSVRRLAAVLVAGVVLLASASAARADTVHIGDNEAPGMFTGSLSVTNVSNTEAIITVKLTNISQPASNGGYLTGFAFNDPNTNAKGNINAISSYTTDPVSVKANGFVLIPGSSTVNNGVSTSPYGNFDIGAAVGGDWLGGGQPSTGGLAVGESATFTFTVTGQGLNNLSAANILAATSSNGTAGFVVRFRGFNDGSSDKDIAGVICPAPPTPTPGAVPAPPGVLLAGMGLGCMILGRVRFRRTPKA